MPTYQATNGQTVFIRPTESGVGDPWTVIFPDNPLNGWSVTIIDIDGSPNPVTLDGGMFPIENPAFKNVVEQSVDIAFYGNAFEFVFNPGRKGGVWALRDDHRSEQFIKRIASPMQTGD